MSSKSIPFEQRYPDTSPGLLNALKSLLEFNPFFRPSATELLKSPIFDSIRMKELEKKKGGMAPFKID